MQQFPVSKQSDFCAPTANINDQAVPNINGINDAQVAIASFFVAAQNFDVKSGLLLENSHNFRLNWPRCEWLPLLRLVSSETS